MYGEPWEEGSGSGVIQAAHVSGFRITFSKQFTPIMITAKTRQKACREGGRGATDCVAIYQPKKGFGDVL